ncbi:MAG: fluoride efflux transporter CrcB [Marinobacter sp.]|nr:MAG: fluoride efflux transporter CrcB [Marinobacter sp.]
MNTLLAIFIGGGLGSVARFGISKIIAANFQNVFPIATLLSNILACIVLAFFIAFLGERYASGSAFKVFILIGFCGGFSTFSTFALETVQLIEQGNHVYAVSNILVSLLTCIGVVYFISKINV